MHDQLYDQGYAISYEWSTCNHEKMHTCLDINFSETLGTNMSIHVNTQHPWHCMHPRQWACRARIHMNACNCITASIPDSCTTHVESCRSISRDSAPCLLTNSWCNAWGWPVACRTATLDRAAKQVARITCRAMVRPRATKSVWCTILYYTIIYYTIT